MECGKVKNVLFDYLKGEVTAGQKARIETHLSACPGCAAEMSVLSRFRKIFSASLQDAPGTVLHNLRSRFRPARAPLFWLKPALTALTVSIMALSVYVYSYNINAKKTELSSFMMNNYNLIDLNSIDNTDYEQTSYIYDQNEL